MQNKWLDRARFVVALFSVAFVYSTLQVALTFTSFLWLGLSVHLIASGVLLWQLYVNLIFKWDS